MTEIIERLCPGCGTPMVGKPAMKLFCTSRCHYRNYLSKREKTCARCGALYPPNGTSKYCSDACRHPNPVPSVATCTRCGRSFKPKSHKHFVCSRECRREMIAPSLSRVLETSTATVGALNELRVCADLLTRGYSVFRALSPASPCDLIAMRRLGQPLRIEVTTGYRREDGTFCYPKHDEALYDHLVIVDIEGRIYYLPEL